MECEILHLQIAFLQLNMWIVIKLNFWKSISDYDFSLIKYGL